MTKGEETPTVAPWNLDDWRSWATPAQLAAADAKVEPVKVEQGRLL